MIQAIFLRLFNLFIPFFEVLLKGNGLLGNGAWCSSSLVSGEWLQQLQGSHSAVQQGWYRSTAKPFSATHQQALASSATEAKLKLSGVDWCLTDRSDPPNTPRNTMTAYTALRTHRKGCMTRSPITIPVAAGIRFALGIMAHRTKGAQCSDGHLYPRWQAAEVKPAQGRHGCYSVTPSQHVGRGTFMNH